MFKQKQHIMLCMFELDAFMKRVSHETTPKSGLSDLFFFYLTK